MKCNEHVILFKELLLEKATVEHRQLAQFFHYTEWEKEKNSDWSPEWISDEIDIY